MAGNEDRKAALIAELARARAEIGGAADGVRAHLDVGARVRRGVSRHQWWWLGGAVFAGVLLATLPARRKKFYMNEKGNRMGESAMKTGLLLGAGKIVFDLAKPMLLRMAMRHARDFVGERWRRKD